MADRLVVVEAANLLQVGEFQLLQLAYREWFGEDLPEALVAQLFATYMLKNEVPHWARHYARLILMREERGALDCDAPTYHRYDHDYHTVVPEGVKRFCTAVGVIAFLLVSSILLANSSVREPMSLLPPYFEKRELQTPARDDMRWGRADEPSGSGHP